MSVMATLAAVGLDPASISSSRCASPRVITVTPQAKYAVAKSSPKPTEPKLGQPPKPEEANTSAKAIPATTTATSAMSSSSLAETAGDRSASPAISSNIDLIIDHQATNGAIDLTSPHSRIIDSLVHAESNGDLDVKKRPYAKRALPVDAERKPKKPKSPKKKKRSQKIPLCDIVRQLTDPLSGTHPDGISPNQLNTYISQQIPDHQRINRSRNHLHVLIWRENKLGTIVRVSSGRYAAPEFVSAIEERRKLNGGHSSTSSSAASSKQNSPAASGESVESESLEEMDTTAAEQSAPLPKPEDGTASNPADKKAFSGCPKPDTRSAKSATASATIVRKEAQPRRRGRPSRALKSGGDCSLLLTSDQVKMASEHANGGNDADDNDDDSAAQDSDSADHSMLSNLGLCLKVAIVAESENDRKRRSRRNRTRKNLGSDFVTFGSSPPNEQRSAREDEEIPAKAGMPQTRNGTRNGSRLLKCKYCGTTAPMAEAGPAAKYQKLSASESRVASWCCAACKVCCVCDQASELDELTFCGHCSKAYHANCHFPELQTKPSGVWICYQCETASRKRGTKRALLLDDDSLLMPPPLSTSVPHHQQHQAAHNGSTKAGLGAAVFSPEEKLNGIINSTISKSQHASACVGKRAKENGLASLQQQRASPRKGAAKPGRPPKKGREEKAQEDPAVIAERTLLLEAAKKAAGWNADDVCNFISDLGFAEQAASVFKEQEIDGVALLLMSRDDVLSRQLSIKVGPALKLYQKIRRLQFAQSQYQV